MRRMIVKDHFKRIGWEELLQFDLNLVVEEEKPKIVNNPFGKKIAANII